MKKKKRQQYFPPLLLFCCVRYCLSLRRPCSLLTFFNKAHYFFLYFLRSKQQLALILLLFIIGNERKLKFFIKSVTLLSREQILMKQKAIKEKNKQHLMNKNSLISISNKHFGLHFRVKIKIYISFCVHRIGYKSGLLQQYNHHSFQFVW